MPNVYQRTQRTALVHEKILSWKNPNLSEIGKSRLKAHLSFILTIIIIHTFTMHL